jgi:DNA primase
MALLDVPAIRQSYPVASVAVGAGVKLRPVAGELAGCCPFHADRSPSFYVFGKGERWHCFGCGATGDVIDLVRRLYSVSMREAAERLAGGNLPLVEAPKVNARGERNNSYALEIIRSSAPIDGTPAAGYVRRRGHSSAPPPSLRFARLKPPKDSGVLAANGPGLLPALVAVVTGPDGTPAGIQRIYLTSDGRKAASTDGKVKFSLGFVRGGAIRLGPALDHGLVLSGSVEDGLSLLEMGAPSVWAAPGEGTVKGMHLPELVRSVVIGADGDAEGRRHAEAAATAIVGGGREVRIVYPGGGAKDFNDELMGAMT